MGKQLFAFSSLLSFALSAAVASHALAGQAPAMGFYNNAEGSPLLQIFDQAKRSLDLEIYEMDDPNVIAAIRRALARNVKVRIVKEPKPVGATCKVFKDMTGSAGSSGDDSGSFQFLSFIPTAPASAADSCDDQVKLVDEVNASGGAYVPFARDALCADGQSCLEHGKMVVADDQVALVSSGNFNSTNLCDLPEGPQTCNRDFSYLTQDRDVVTTLKNVFNKDLSSRAYDMNSVVSEAAAQKLTVGPLSLDPIVAFIKSARSSIQIENQYLKDPTMNQALIDAAQSGVKVEVTIASACSFGKPKAGEVAKLTQIFKSFEAVGIDIKMFNKNIQVNGLPGYLHAKAIVADGARAWMGSVNGSTQAATRNREFGVFFKDASDVRRLASVLSSDHADPNEESWQDSLNCAENRRR